MLYISEYSAELVYYGTNYVTTILHLVSIIVMLLLFLARNKMLLKHVCNTRFAMYLCTGFSQITLSEYISGYIVGTFIISD
jgi:hypothetical protein